MLCYVIACIIECLFTLEEATESKCFTTVSDGGLFTLSRKSLDLVESLLRLSEVGQYEQVKQLFNFPTKHCPDMLVLALLQISTSWHTLRHELISTLMPIFLGNHPNSAIILHYAWHGQVGLWLRCCVLFVYGQLLLPRCFLFLYSIFVFFLVFFRISIFSYYLEYTVYLVYLTKMFWLCFKGQSPSIRQLIMHSMAEWYMRGEQYDQAKLSRILDVAQDLKVCRIHFYLACTVYAPTYMQTVGKSTCTKVKLSQNKYT